MVGTHIGDLEVVYAVLESGKSIAHLPDQIEDLRICGLPLDPRQNEWLPCRHRRPGEGYVSSLVEQMAEREGVTEQIKAEDQMAWVVLMNNIADGAREIMSAELVFT